MGIQVPIPPTKVAEGLQSSILWGWRKIAEAVFLLRLAPRPASSTCLADLTSSSALPLFICVVWDKSLNILQLKNDVCKIYQQKKKFTSIPNVY